jgi:NarL family two-component system response regulator LiaR
VPPISVAVVNDCQLVVDGVASMLRPYADRVRIVELDCRMPVVASVDVALYDAFAVDTSEAHLLPHLHNPAIGALAVYTWTMTEDDVRRMLALGVRGVLAKHLDAPALVAAVEAVHAGEVVVSDSEPPSPERNAEELDNPLPNAGLTAREAEVVALIALGLSNAEISHRLYITANTLKTYIRSSYRKMGVERRSQAVAWAVDHGLRPSTRRTVLDLERPAS